MLKKLRGLFRPEYLTPHEIAYETEKLRLENEELSKLTCRQKMLLMLKDYPDGLLFMQLVDKTGINRGRLWHLLQSAIRLNQLEKRNNKYYPIIEQQPTSTPEDNHAQEATD